MNKNFKFFCFYLLLKNGILCLEWNLHEVSQKTLQVLRMDVAKYFYLWYDNTPAFCISIPFLAVQKVRPEISLNETFFTKYFICFTVVKTRGFSKILYSRLQITCNKLFRSRKLKKLFTYVFLRNSYSSKLQYIYYISENLKFSPQCTYKPVFMLSA